MQDRSYLDIVKHYESCLDAHGSGARAVDWKNERDALLRYDVMLDLVKAHDQAATLLDFGCGLASLKSHLSRRGLETISYTGLEISPDFARAARSADPEAEILCMDVLKDDTGLPRFDYVVMNGIFTRRQNLSNDEMEAYMQQLLSVVFAHCRVGLAFNVMSAAVDWTTEALFHPDHGRVLNFIGDRLSRHFVLRNDYGLHETTFYVYRQPVTNARAEGGADE